MIQCPGAGMRQQGAQQAPGLIGGLFHQTLGQIDTPAAQRASRVWVRFGRLGDVDAVAGGPEHAECRARDLGLEVATEAVDQEHDLR